jgi:hypothetical protein
MPDDVFLRGKVYYVRYSDADGRRRMKRLSADKRVAERMARRILAERDRNRDGSINRKDHEETPPSGPDLGPEGEGGSEVAFETPEEAAKSLGDTISPERLIELAEAGYAPHYLIDGRGPWFKIAELRRWFDRNAVQARRGLPMPTRLSLIVSAASRPASDAPASISRLTGLRHIDPGHLLCPGVYFLCQGDEVVYVGQSINVPGRIMFHIRESRQAAGKTFDPLSIFYLPVPEGELSRVESEFIGRLRPKYNGETSRPTGQEPGPTEPGGWGDRMS